ncbi:MAG: hypothetical protein VYA48_03750 [Gemmatimonadota bacterium]|nr:hypothetical protein [Gemmatimonadota bacterium]
MRVLGVVMAAIALLVSVPADVAAQDLSGMWIITIQSPEGDQPLPVTIVQDGEDLKATGEIPELGPVEIVGTIQASQIRMEWDFFIEGMELNIVFTGAVAEDGTLAGSADFGGFGEGAWTATRVEN